ncbi:hypothetical protein HDU88_007965 [Geranomyces variabilis]|nr:hypothetical protein HDU88_007965 [Geranomyces variabilis]
MLALVRVSAGTNKGHQEDVYLRLTKYIERQYPAEVLQLIYEHADRTSRDKMRKAVANVRMSFNGALFQFRPTAEDIMDDEIIFHYPTLYMDKEEEDDWYPDPDDL